MLNETADVLFALDRLDGDTWAARVIGATEIALGHPLPMLYGAATRGWVPPERLAQQLSVPVDDVLAIASVLGITTSRPRSVSTAAAASICLPPPPTRSSRCQSPPAERPAGPCRSASP